MLELDNVSPEVAEVYEEILDEPLVDIEELVTSLLSYRDKRVAEIAAVGEFIDEELLGALTARSVELLERIDADYDPSAHRYGQALARLLMANLDEAEEGENIEFNNDLEIFNELAGELGHDDLQIGF